MRYVNCEQCGGSVPVAQSFSVLECQMCEDCATAWASENPDQVKTEGTVVQQIDPTVCAV